MKTTVKTFVPHFVTHHRVGTVYADSRYERKAYFLLATSPSGKFTFVRLNSINPVVDATYDTLEEIDRNFMHDYEYDAEVILTPVGDKTL